MAKLILLKAGLFTSIQDSGRSGFRQYGVPISGTMDQQSAQLANLLVNNPPHAAVMEITQTGPKIHFEETALIAITGADLSPTLNEKKIKLNQALIVEPGMALSFGKPQYGTRAYLAIQGGIESESVLNSESMYPSITSKGKLTKDDTLNYIPTKSALSKLASVQINLNHFENQVLQVWPGPEWSTLSTEQQQILLTEPYTIGLNNRMGYQISNNNMPAHNMQIITSPVVPGTVQLTPSGKLMALMRDAQVTGGYPRVLQLTEDSINRLAQKNMGMKVRFELLPELAINE